MVSVSSVQCVCCEDPVYLHPSSCLLTTPPEYVVCQELIEASNRLYMRGMHVSMYVCGGLRYRD